MDPRESLIRRLDDAAARHDVAALVATARLNWRLIDEYVVGVVGDRVAPRKFQVTQGAAEAYREVGFEGTALTADRTSHGHRPMQAATRNTLILAAQSCGEPLAGNPPMFTRHALDILENRLSVEAAAKLALDEATPEQAVATRFMRAALDIPILGKRFATLVMRSAAAGAVGLVDLYRLFPDVLVPGQPMPLNAPDSMNAAVGGPTAEKPAATMQVRTLQGDVVHELLHEAALASQEEGNLLFRRAIAEASKTSQIDDDIDVIENLIQSIGRIALDADTIRDASIMLNQLARRSERRDEVAVSLASIIDISVQRHMIGELGEQLLASCEEVLAAKLSNSSLALLSTCGAEAFRWLGNFRQALRLLDMGEKPLAEEDGLVLAIEVIRTDMRIAVGDRAVGTAVLLGFLAGDGGPNKELLAYGPVREALGGSLMAEELRGDYVRARQAAAEAGVLEVCLVDAMTGRSGAACRRLAELDALDWAQHEVVSRLRLFADTMHFQHTPAHTGELFEDLENRRDRMALARSCSDSPSLAGSQSAHELRLLSVYDTLIAERSRLVFMSLEKQPQDAVLVTEDAILSRTASMLASTLTLAHGRLSNLDVKHGGAVHRPCSTTWIAIAKADLFRRAGDPEGALDMIRDERGRREAAGDRHGAALCWLAEGDIRACALESPMTLGLSPRAANGVDNALTYIESREHVRVRESELAAARATFIEAQRLFAKVGAPRGVAAAELRLAGVAALTGDHVEACARAHTARSDFIDAGDEAHGHLAHIHVALANVARMLPVDINAIRKIGTWGAGDGDLGYALGLGFLLMRAARRWLVRDAGYEQSIRCTELAEELFRAAGAPLAAAQAVGDEFNAHETIRDRDAAFVAARRADDMLASISPGAVSGVPWRRLKFQQAAWSLASAAADPSNMELFATRLVGAVNDVVASAGGQDSIVAQFVNSAIGESSEDPEATAAATVTQIVIAEHMIHVSTTIAPQYRAYDLELDPNVSDDRREQAWQAAAAALTTWPEPERWFYLAALYGARNDRTNAAETSARYFATRPSLIAPTQDARLAATLREKVRNEAELPFMTFIRLEDVSRARVHLDLLVSGHGENWWERSSEPWEMLAYQADLLRLEGDVASALATYDRARDVLEHQRAMLRDDGAKTAFADSPSAQRMFTHAAIAALRLGIAGQARAFDFIERGRARALADLISDVRTSTDDGAPIARWREACAHRDLQRALIANALAAKNPSSAQIELLQGKLEEWETKAAELEAAARAQSPTRFQKLNAHAAIAPLSEVIGRIPDGVVVIELSLVGRRLMGWALTCNGMRAPLVRELDDDRPLRRDIRAFRQACADTGYSLGAGLRLATMLLAPFADTIRAGSQVVVVASGDLSLVPFHALPFDGDSLIARVAVSYAPSASLLEVLTTKPVAGEPILVVGDPPGMSSLPENQSPLPALPGARLEAETVAALVSNSWMLSADASRQKVAAAMPRFRVIHLATHGVADLRSPWSSAIMLANSERLTMSDLMGLELDADLVILSACDSGNGKVTRGEEILGLARALLAAGARAVIVSLWRVNDQATRLLMTELHHGLQRGERPAVALRDAQLAVRRLDTATVADELATRGIPADRAAVRRTVSLADDPPRLTGYDHPMFWAPFVLIGV